MLFIYKRAVSREFKEIQGNTGFLHIQRTVGLAQRPPPDTREGRLASRPPPDAREGRLARILRSTLARGGWRESSARRSRGEAGENPPPDARKLAGVGRNVRRQGNSPDAGLSPSNPGVPDARDIVGRRKSTILDGFLRGRAKVGHVRNLPDARKLAGVGEKSAPAEIRPTLQVQD